MCRGGEKKGNRYGQIREVGSKEGVEESGMRVEDGH
jgi:hypothetical protein